MLRRRINKQKINIMNHDSPLFCLSSLSSSTIVEKPLVIVLFVFISNHFPQRIYESAIQKLLKMSPILDNASFVNSQHFEGEIENECENRSIVIMRLKGYNLRAFNMFVGAGNDHLNGRKSENYL